MKHLILPLLLLCFCACTRKASDGNTLNLSIPQEIATLDPANCYDTVCYVPVTQVYETLYELDYLKRPYSLRPLLAEGMPQISRDRRTYTFRLKKGIKYHSSPWLQAGREVKAQDFVTQIKRLAFRGNKSQGFWLMDGKVKGINEWREQVDTDLEKFLATPIPGVRATDDHTLVIELLRPYPQLLWAMALTFTSPVPEEAVRASGNDLSNEAVGTGPYFITRYNPSQEVILKKFEGYASSVYPTEGDRFAHEKGLLKDAGAKLPFVENVRMTVMKEAQTEWLNFQKRKIDLINLINYYHVALTNDGKLKPELVQEKIQVQSSPTLIYWWIAFNMKDSVFAKNQNLRLAVAHAINIDRYIEEFTQNVHQKANSIYPPGIPGYSPSAELPYKYDLQKARDYLAKAGYPGGKGFPKIDFHVRGTDTRKRQMGEFIQQELKQIGLEVQVQMHTFPAFLEKSRKGEFAFWQGGWVLDYPDAENVLQLLTSANMPPGPNSSMYQNPEYDQLFDQLREMEDGPEKFRLMARMEAIVNRDLPWVMEYYSRNYILYHDYLKNYRYSDIIYNYLKYLKLEAR
jgi:ABC-type transport system substrate-binding protein